jgi:hypothetical protein
MLKEKSVTSGSYQFTGAIQPMAAYLKELIRKTAKNQVKKSMPAMPADINQRLNRAGFRR